MVKTVAVYSSGVVEVEAYKVGELAVEEVVCR